MTSRIMKTSSLSIAFLCLAMVLSSAISHFIRSAHAQRSAAAKTSEKLPFDVSAARLERNRLNSSSNRSGAALPGSPGNSLVIRGGSFDVVTCTYSSPHDGTVRLGTNGPVVSYTNLTPMTIGITIADLVLVLPNGTVGGRLQDDGSAGNNTV